MEIHVQKFELHTLGCQTTGLNYKIALIQNVSSDDKSRHTCAPVPDLLIIQEALGCLAALRFNALCEIATPTEYLKIKIGQNAYDLWFSNNVLLLPGLSGGR